MRVSCREKRGEVCKMGVGEKEKIASSSGAVYIHINRMVTGVVHKTA